MKRMIIACMLFAAAACTFTACNSAEEPVIAQPDGQTTPMTRAATIENFARHLIVEVNDVNILNAGEYYFSNGEPFFTHVVIYSSNIRGDANGNVYAYNNPNNAAILADPDKYIKPLQAKGIKVLLGYLGDHTGAGFANLTNQQAESFCNQIIEVGEAAGVDGYFLDDEWSEYGTRGWPPANSTSFSNVILKLRNKTDKIITLLDWGNTNTLSPEAVACIDLTHQGSLNGYYLSSMFPVSHYLPFSIDLRGPLSDSAVKVRTIQSMRANAGGIGIYDLRMEPTRLSTFNAVAWAFDLTCTHTGVTYPKDYGN